MIDPRILRGGFRIGLFILAVALVTLPFQPRDSPELVVTVMSAVVGGAFVLAIIAVARWGQPSPPNDEPRENDYDPSARRRGP